MNSLKFQALSNQFSALRAERIRSVLIGTNVWDRVDMKWSGKFGQRAKMYPTRTNGYENDKATELFRPV